jgi:uncharacterized protein (TIGR00661 family)
MVYEDNAVRIIKTFIELVKKLPAFADNFEAFTRIAESFRPEVVISDFETFAYLYAKQHELPVFSVDNMQIINRCELEVEIPPELRQSYEIAKTVVKAKLPRSSHYFITTFFFPPVNKERTSLYPPILRDAILNARPTAGAHILVYQTSDTNRDLIDVLRSLPGEFRVYGYRRNEQLGNVTLKDFAEQGFVDDLASARAVVAGGGFSLMGEAVYLGKPMYAVPLEGQFEQTLNALYLQKLGYGEYHTEVTAPDLARFLERTGEYATNLRAHKQDGNRAILDALDHHLALLEEESR